MVEHQQNSAGAPPKPPKRSGGPSTTDGKFRSSRNAVKHGCRSHILILPDETQEDFDDLYDRWMATYQPIIDAETELVEKLILERWYLQRNERRYSEVEQQLAAVEFTSWTEQDHKSFQLAQRYKTAAERSVTRAMNELENFLKNRKREQKDARREFDQTLRYDEKQNRDVVDRGNQKLAGSVQLQSRARSLFQGQNSPKKLRKIPILDQWIEITSVDGQTVTTLYPPNDVLIAEGQAMHPPPELVYRRLHFPSGVPAEYEWTTKDPITRKYGGMGLQRMTVDHWLEVIDLENTRTDGHIGAIGERNLPRPRERGACDCEFCTQAWKQIDQREIDQRKIDQREIDQREIDQREIDQREIDQREIDQTKIDQKTSEEQMPGQQDETPRGE